MFFLIRAAFLFVVFVTLNFISTEAKSNACVANPTYESVGPVHVYYLPCEKALVTYNKENNFAVVLTEETFSGYYTKTGFGGVLNPETKLGLFKEEGFEPLDVSGIENGNHEKAQEIYQYAAELIPKVIGKNAFNSELLNSTLVLTDAAKTSDCSKWSYVRGNKPLVKDFQESLQAPFEKIHAVLEEGFPIDQSVTAWMLYGFGELDKPASYYSNYDAHRVWNKISRQFKNLISTSGAKAELKNLIDSIESVLS